MAVSHSFQIETLLQNQPVDSIMEMFIYLLIALAVTAALAPKPPVVKPASLEDFDLPTAVEGRPIPVLFGTALIRGLNVLWYGNLRSHQVRRGGSLFSHSHVAGTQYYLDLSVAICHGQLEFCKVFVDDKFFPCWYDYVPPINFGYADPVQTNNFMEASQAYHFGEWESFGGYRQGGGFAGTCYYYDGSKNQDACQPMADGIGQNVPAYRGIAHIFFHDFYFVANSTYLKPISALVKRRILGWNTTPLAQNLIEIGDHDMNPAAIIYQCLTDPDWGMGASINDLDYAAFASSALALLNENFGLSYVWLRQSAVEELIQDILNTINGTLRIDESTGKWSLKLIRDDYQSGDLLQVNESNSELLSFERAGYAERVNEISVNYTDRETGETKTVTQNNIAAIQAAGGVISKSVTYAGIKEESLALKVAARDLRHLSAPTSLIKLKINLTGWQLKEGDLFSYSSDFYGLNNVVYRVIELKTGNPENPYIRIKAVEDVFKMASNSLVVEQPDIWQDTTATPVPIIDYRLQQTAYIDLVNEFGQTSADQLNPNGLYVSALCRKPAGQNLNANLMHSETGAAGQYYNRETGSYIERFQLFGNDRSKADTIFTLNKTTGLMIGDRFWIGNEYCAISAIDTANNQITVKRAIGNSAPEKHTALSMIYFQRGARLDYFNEAPSATNHFKLIGSNNNGAGLLSDFTAISVTPSQEHLKPYPPANVQVEGAFFPVLVSNPLFSVSWVARNRTLQSGEAISFYGAGVAPDPADSYTLIIKGETGATISTNSGIVADGSGNASFTYSGAKTYRYTIELTTNGAAGNSQTVDHTFNAGDPVAILSPNGGLLTTDWTETAGSDAGLENGLGVRQFQALYGSLYFMNRAEYNVNLAEEYQDIDLTAYRTTAEIDAGTEFIYLGWAQAHSNNESRGGCNIEFYDETMTLISSPNFPRITTGNLGFWNDREYSAAIPATARTVRIYVALERLAGDPATTFIDGGIANINARIY